MIYSHHIEESHRTCRAEGGVTRPFSVVRKSVNVTRRLALEIALSPSDNPYHEYRNFASFLI